MERENTEMISLFFNLFSKALANHIGDPNYKFNPMLIMTDEAYANLQGIKDAMASEYPGKIVTCQWHFQQCAWQQLSRMQEEDKAPFIDVTKCICTAMTIHKYKKYVKLLKKYVVTINASTGGIGGRSDVTTSALHTEDMAGQEVIGLK